MSSITESLKQVPFFRGEKVLVYIGILGFALGAISVGYIWMFGAIQLPEGDVSKAVSFNIAFGFFILTTAALLPLANFKRRTHLRIRWILIVTTLYGYAIETIQHMRGIDPRFTMYGSVADSIFGLLFALASLCIIICYVFITIRFFCSDTLQHNRLLVIGIRYGLITTLIGFAAGVWISIIQTRYTGLEGNIIWIHGFGFHGLQIMPLIGLFLGWASAKHHKWLHIAGFLWTALMVMIGIETLLGRSIFEVSPLMVIAHFCTVALITITVAAAIRPVISLVKSDGAVEQHHEHI